MQLLPVYHPLFISVVFVLIRNYCDMVDGITRGLLLLWRAIVNRWRQMQKPPTFTRFSELPCEIRLMIWEAAVPNRPVDQNSVCNLWYFMHDDSYESKQSIKIDAQHQPYQPFGLLWACHQSRSVVLSRMSLLMYETEDHQGPRPKRRLKLVDNTMRTIMPSSRTTNWPLGVPKSFQSYAEFMPEDLWFPTIISQLISDQRHNIKTLLFGVRWIPLPYSMGNDPEKFPCVDSATAAVPLDDPRLLGYLRRAFRRHARNMNEDISEECHRKSAMRYLAWQRFIFDEVHLILEGFKEHLDYKVKPCVIFGMALHQPAEVLHREIAMLDRFMYRSEDAEDVEEWDASTPFPPPTNWTYHKLCQARFWRGCQLLSYHIHPREQEY
ncbi:hypothetical protein NW768_008157 [Fusarium equiseti]|uniref:2EXR domain-containing protein n=1 Tax=Fusarium equiseti TaxID=61235 RepID=A0ABQ8R6F3_FUSEQ|nr:hypothetical protein NW768_008157 [Fusarium equiseti]